MAITKTNKLGLPLYSAGTDPHPGRVDHNTIMQAINDNAMGVKQGLHAERPGAGVAGRTYFSTDRNTAAYDNGTTWVEYVPIGGLAPSGVRAGATGPVLSGAGGNEGMSTKLARADHTHAVPLATDDLPGLLNADMFYLLARMTDSATPSTMVRRDANARVSVGTPTDGAHAATKAYADLVASNASNLTTGTIPAGRLPLATKTVAGAMAAADKALLDNATHLATKDALLKRDANGDAFLNVLRLQTQSADNNAATQKTYVDTQDAAARAYADSLVGTSAAPMAHQHDAADVSSGVFAAARLPLASASAAGAMSAAHFSLLAGATSAATANTLVKNDANGRFQTVTPAAAADVANKGYVDGKKWVGEDLTGGTISPDRIANATSTLDGLMPKADKAKLDGAVPAATALALVRRDTAGRFQVPDPSTNPLDVVNRGYVDGKTWTAADTVSGVFAAARLPLASASAAGAMSAAHFSLLAGATATAEQANSIVRRTSGGHIMGQNFLTESPQPGAVNSLTRKDYVDAGLAKQVSLSGDVGTADLNNIITPGEYYASSTGNATLARNYPAAGIIGTLSVRRFHDTQVWVTQVFTAFESHRVFVRSAGTATTWRAWTELASTDYASDASNLTKGTVDPARIANATSALDGLMSKSDKAKLDAATVLSNGNTIARRDSTGAVRFDFVVLDGAQNNGGNTATRKDYVDSSIKGLLVGNLIPGGVDLDTYTTSGVYHQNQTTLADVALNYPAKIAGRLEVTINDTGTFVYQRYTAYGASGRVYERARYAGTWYPWSTSYYTVSAKALTGWDTTSFTVYDVGQEPTLRVQGGIVNVSGALKAKIADIATGVDGPAGPKVAYIPPEFRPEGAVNVWVVQGSSRNTWCLSLETDGYLHANRYGPGTPGVNAWFPFNVSWPIKEG